MDNSNHIRQIEQFGVSKENNHISRCDINQLKLAGFDDDSDWSDEQASSDSVSAISAAVTKGQEFRRTSVPKATEMEVVSPLVRSIFEGRKKLILDASHRGKKDQGGQGATKQVAQKEIAHVVEEYEETLLKKVQALDEEIAIFKKESKRLKNLTKENEEGLARLARERAEWEQQKKSQMRAFQAQQEEQIEKLKKERQILEHRSASLNSMPAVQRKEVEELKETLARQQEEHRRKETRLRLTVNRLKAMNEDLTKQLLEMQDEIRRYESCLLSALDGRECSSQAAPISTRRPCGESKYKHFVSEKQTPHEIIGENKSKTSSWCFVGENWDTFSSLHVDGAEHLRNGSTPRILSEQAKILSDLFSQPWKAAREYTVKEDTSSRQQMSPRLAEWR